MIFVKQTKMVKLSYYEIFELTFLIIIGGIEILLI